MLGEGQEKPTLPHWKEEIRVEPTRYEDLSERARRLSPRDQRRLLEELRDLVERQTSGPEASSILELQGLGKGVWAGQDAQDYVDRERASTPPL